MTEREALKLALEALEAHADIGIKSDYIITAIADIGIKSDYIITAIKEALAQPEQCRHRIADARNKVIKDGYICVDCGSLFSSADHNEAQPEQEPVAWTRTDTPAPIIHEEVMQRHPELRQYYPVPLYYAPGE